MLSYFLLLIIFWEYIIIDEVSSGIDKMASIIIGYVMMYDLWMVRLMILDWLMMGVLMIERYSI